jgi:hypothetical protein
MVEYVNNPDTSINGITVGDIADWVYASAAGQVFFMPNSAGKADPVLTIGGEDHEIISTARHETEGTIDKTSYKEGVRTNPLVLFPSSFFTPIPPWLNSLMPGPLATLSNPTLLVTIIAVVAAAHKEEDDSYSYSRRTLPTKVIDNQELEDQLFGN